MLEGGAGKVGVLKWVQIRKKVKNHWMGRHQLLLSAKPTIQACGSVALKGNGLEECLVSFQGKRLTYLSCWDCYLPIG